jgi:serine/threonine protein kinase
MPLNIQHASPSHVKLCLLPQPYGTFVLRYPVENDALISMIRIDYQSKQEFPINRYIILSIRVDETVYKYDIQHYLLPYTEQNNQEDNKQLLEPYNRQQKIIKNGKFTALKKELILPRENKSWFFDKRCLQDIDFSSIENTGQHNRGLSIASWQCDKQNDIKVFIKRFAKDNWYFKHELSLLKDLHHFPIITLYGQFSDNQYSYLVFEDGGKSLESYCPLKHRTSKAKMRFIANVGFQVAQAMMYLEKKNIVHRDLTAGNVLINSYGFIRIADFGHALKKEEGKNTLERPQTRKGEHRFQYRFLAPECLPNAIPNASNTSPTSVLADIYARFSSKSDVWSFGILLIQLMLDDPRLPYPLILNVNNIPQYVKEERHIHPRPSECPTDMYLVLERCWAYEAINRISFTELRDKMIALETILR